MSKLTQADVPLLRKLGFKPGWSGESWFGLGRDSVVYQAAQEEDSDDLYILNCKTRLRVDLDKEGLYDLFEKEE